jgi:uroporphyrinogen-III synthase
LLTTAGAHVEAITAYHTVSITADGQLLAAGFDAITFMSASAVSSFVAQVDDIGGALIACIGPVTAAAAREAGLPVHVTADPHTAEGLVSGLAQALERMFTL